MGIIFSEKLVKTLFLRNDYLIIVLINNSTAQNNANANYNASPNKFSRIEKLLSSYVDSLKLPGINVLVSKNDEIIYSKSFGYADIESKKLLNANNLYRIASMTKLVTAVGILILNEDGYLHLEDPVSYYLPEFKNMNVVVPDSVDENNKIIKYHIEPAKNEITILHLLTHTSGLTYEMVESKPVSKLYLVKNIDSGVRPNEITSKESTKKIASTPLLFEPGKRWEYSLSYDVLGYLIERVSGQSMEDFMKKRIFTPLKMSDTFFIVPQNKLNRLARLYTIEENKLIKVNGTIAIGTFTFSNDFQNPGKRKYHSGGGGLISSINDYYKFLKMLMNYGQLGDVKILNRKSVEIITSTQAPEIDIGMEGYRTGFGVAVRTESGNTSIGEYTWGGLFFTRFFVDPKEELIGIFMSQLYPYRHNIEVYKKFKSIVYETIIN